MFIKKTHALKDRDTIQAQNSKLQDVVAEACRIVPKLHIPEDTQPEAKIRKLATGVSKEKAKVVRV